MRIFAPALVAVLLLTLWEARMEAGDAVMWDPVTRHFVAEYSSTPDGGTDYFTDDQARQSVLKTMMKQKVVDPALLWKSDRTGYFAVWTGVTTANQTVAAVGFGATEAEAKVNGFAGVRKAGAAGQFYIAYRYASYGSDYDQTAPPLVDLATSAVESEEIGSLSPDGRFALSTAHSRGWKLRKMDLVDLQNFQPLLELGTPTTVFGSIVWSSDAQRLAFFGEERAYGETTVYFLEEGKYVAVALPGRDTFPEPELGLKQNERIFKTNYDVVRPKAWLTSGDLELEHAVEVVVERGFEKVGTAEGITTMTIHFDDAKSASIVKVTEATTRKDEKEEARK